MSDSLWEFKRPTEWKLRKLCSGIFSNMVEASMLREASIDVKQYMVSTPMSTGDAPASFKGGEGYDANDASKTNKSHPRRLCYISVEDVIYRFLKHFRKMGCSG